VRNVPPSARSAANCRRSLAWPDLAWPCVDRQATGRTGMSCASRFGARCGPVRTLLSKQPNVNKNSRSTSEGCNTKERYAGGPRVERVRRRRRHDDEPTNPHGRRSPVRTPAWLAGAARPRARKGVGHSNPGSARNPNRRTRAVMPLSSHSASVDEDRCSCAAIVYVGCRSRLCRDRS